MPVIGIADMNSFYCSAELLFQPWLKDRAVVVASNNDGAVVARNDLAKALGIKMAQPVFELKEMMARGEVIVFSSNYALYQSMSNRFMSILEEFAPSIAPYSVDECFISLSGVRDPEAWARQTRDIIQSRIGIGVGIGIAPTKTLAKLANWAAKKWKVKTGCVVDLRDNDRREKLLRYAPVNEVWGIGTALTKRLQTDFRIRTAWDLATADPKHLRRHLSVNVERTARELSGTPCFPFAEGGPERKQMIISSRSFGEKVFSLDELEGAVAGFVTTASVKLRSQLSMANCIQVFANTSPFSRGEQYRGSRIIAMPYPTNDSRDLLSAALTGLRQLYRPGPAYAKAGIILSQFVEAAGITDDLFAPKPRANSAELMKVIDAINAKQGRGTIRLARDKGEGTWSMRREMLSDPYTTSWLGLPVARCT